MTLQEIQSAVKSGKTVHWSNPAYIVTYRLNATLQEEEWFIKHTGNSHMIGLTWSDGTTMNGKEQDFFIEEEPAEKVKKLSTAFNKVLNEWLTPEQMAEIVRLNATPEYQGGCCSTHNFCDPNQAMIDAFLEVIGREIDHQSDNDTELLNAAWELSNSQNFAIQ